MWEVSTKVERIELAGRWLIERNENGHFDRWLKVEIGDINYANEPFAGGPTIYPVHPYVANL